MLRVHEERYISDDYDELVIYNDEIDEWNKIFIDFFGDPIKPPGVKPTIKDLHLTRNYGSILINQTLFKKDSVNNIVIAMLWPWQDNVHTTLKIARLKK